MSDISINVYNTVNKAYTTFIKPFRWAGNKIYNGYDLAFPCNEVTGCRELRIISIGMEKIIGNSLYLDYILAEGFETVDYELQEEIQTIGDRLAKEAKRKLDYYFTVIDTNKINAWALPNGKIAICQGLINKINNFYKKIQKDQKYKDVTIDDIRSAVLAHEIVHADARHTAKRFEIFFIGHAIIFALQLITSIFIKTKLEQTQKIKKQNKEPEKLKENQNLENNLNLIQAIANKAFRFLRSRGFSLYLYASSKAHEHQADTYGMELMQKAGYNPKGALALQEMFFQIEGSKEPSKLERCTIGLFRSHPYAIDRLRANEEKLKQISKE